MRFLREDVKVTDAFSLFGSWRSQAQNLAPWSMQEGAGLLPLRQGGFPRARFQEEAYLQHLWPAEERPGVFGREELCPAPARLCVLD